MSDDMTLEAYLAAGGKLSNPTNVPPRYRAELLKLMATFVDSELAGAAGFADVINQGPGIKERIAAARIVLEKTDHAEKVLTVMADFGVDVVRYANHHPWVARLERGADIGSTRTDHDMRLAVFNYPLNGWADAVVMNLLMGLAVGGQLAEMSQISYQPLAETMRVIAPVEARHAELALEGLTKLSAQNHSGLQDSVTYWWPRVAASFGSENSDKFSALQAMGLRATTNADLRSDWMANARTALGALGLNAPA